MATHPAPRFLWRVNKYPTWFEAPAGFSLPESVAVWALETKPRVDKVQILDTNHGLVRTFRRLPPTKVRLEEVFE